MMIQTDWMLRTYQNKYYYGEEGKHLFSTVDGKFDARKRELLRT